MKKYKNRKGITMWLTPRIGSMDSKQLEFPHVKKLFKSEVRYGFHRLIAEHFGETFEVEASINRDGRLQIKVRVMPGIGNDLIVKSFESGLNKRGTIIKIDHEDLPDVPQNHYYPELMHENEHFPVQAQMDHWKKIGLLKAI